MTKAKPKKATHDGYIWIELPPHNGDKEFAQRQCDCVNTVLKAMMGEDTYCKFFVGERHEQVTYNIITSEAGTYLECVDRGHWFPFESLIPKKQP